MKEEIEGKDNLVLGEERTWECNLMKNKVYYRTREDSDREDKCVY